MNLNFQSMQAIQPNMKPHNPLDSFAKGFSSDVSDIERLQRKLDEQKMQVDALMKAVSQSQPTLQLSQQRYQQTMENEKYNNDLLHEIKKLKRKLKQIENGPPAPQFPQVPLMYPQQQQFYPPYQQFQGQQQVPFIPFGLNPQFQYLQPQYLNQQQNNNQQKTMSQVLQELARKKDEDQMKQLMLQLLNKDHNTSDRDVSQSLRRNQKSSKKLVKIKRNRDQNPTFDNNSLRPDESPLQDRQNTKHQTHKSRTIIKIPPKVKVTPQRLKYLMRKFKFAILFIQQHAYFKIVKQGEIEDKKAFDKFNDEVGLYDAEFGFDKQVLDFFLSSQKQSLFKKSWVFTEKKEVPQRIINLIQITYNLLEFVIKGIGQITYSQNHLKFIKLFTKNGGYLFSGHSAFVSFRIQISKKNKQIKNMSIEQSQMAFLEYAYIQIFIQKGIIECSKWPQVIQNYAEPLKILLSLLQYLFIEKYNKLPIIATKNRYNNESVSYLDFNQRNFVDIQQFIDSTKQNYKITDKALMLGLYDETTLKPVIEHPNYAKLRDLFTLLCNQLYTKIGYQT